MDTTGTVTANLLSKTTGLNDIYATSWIINPPQGYDGRHGNLEPIESTNPCYAHI